jgi:hypothetical protein
MMKLACASKFAILSIRSIWFLLVVIGGAGFSFARDARGASGITLTQSAGKDAGSATSSSLAFNTNNTAGNFIAVCVRAGMSGQTITVTDSRGNTYRRAVQYNVTTDTPNGDTLGIFYAENIAGGANTVSVSDTIAGTLRFAIVEYSGVATANSLDVVAMAQGTSAAATSGSATTTANGDLMVGAMLSGDGVNWTAGSGYSIAASVPGQPSAKLIVESEVQAAAGSISAGATLGMSDSWGAGMAAFKAGTASSAPSIASVNPASGASGTPVTISGANFGATQGTSTVTFSGMAATPTSWSAGSIVAPVPAGATSGSVVVTVGGVASNGMTFAMHTGSGGIALMQIVGKDAGVTTSSSLAFSASNQAGNWIGVCVRAGALNETITVTDTRGNAYHKAVQFNQTTDGFTYGIFYAENVAGGANTVTVSDSVSGILRFAILEYAGVATSGSLDVVGTAQGHSATPSSGAGVTTTANGDLLLGAVMTGNGDAFTAGANFKIEGSVPAEPGTKLMVEDWVQTSAGAAVASATLGSADDWAAGVAAFKAFGGVGGAAPSITSLNPTSGAVNSAVTISGANFGATQGTSTVKFNGVTAATTSWGAASITATVPAGATTGNVVVTVGGVASNGVSFAVAAAAPTITTQPANTAVTAGQAATFSAVASGSTPLSYQWQKNSVNISGATAASYTTPPVTMADSGATFLVKVSNSAGNATSNSATLTVNAASAGTDVTTYHNDIARTGQNLTETILTPANVNSGSFGLKRNLPVDGLVDAEPLYLSQLEVAGAMHNVVFVATEHDSVYAFDADTGTQLWKVSMLGSGETTSDSRNCGQVTPEIGVTSTPVIDRGAGRMYVVAMSKNGSTYIQRIHALDLTTGADVVTPVAVQATYPGSGAGGANGTVTFDPKQYKERAALLLLNGIVYTSWGSHCDIDPYTAWIIGYDETSLSRTSVLNLTPNGSEGSVWQSGGGLAADPQGNIYALMANGTFDTTLDANGFPNMQDYGNAFVKISTSGGALKVADYFDMSGTVSESNADKDLGSGGPMVLPDLTNGGNTMQLAVGAGKDGHLYVVDRTNMGKFNASANNIYEDMSGALPNGVWGVPAYFNNTVYYCDQNNNLKAFSISNARLSTTPTKTATSFSYPGALPAVSANGSSNGIVWALENTNPAVLHAYSANNLATELYNSNQAAGGRDQFGAGNKYITPMIADGKVFAATKNSVAVFGLLP